MTCAFNKAKPFLAYSHLSYVFKRNTKFKKQEIKRFVLTHKNYNIKTNMGPNGKNT